MTPDTLLRWRRELVARKWTYLERRRPGRPRTKAEIAELIIRMATENPRWGYTRIQGALSNLRLNVGRGTIRPSSWKMALNPVRTGDYLVGILESALASPNRHRFPDPGGLELARTGDAMARNLLDVDSGILAPERMLIMDRDAKYSLRFRRMLAREGIVVIRLPLRSPNLNAYAERFVRSVKEECLSQIVPIGQGMARRALREYGTHYHAERNHQGIENRLIDEPTTATPDVGPISRRRRLGGMLNYYERLAA